MPVVTRDDDDDDRDDGRKGYKMIVFVMVLVMAFSLVMCVIDGTFEWLTVTLIAGILAFIFQHSTPYEDNRTALEIAQDGMEQSKTRREGERPLFGGGLPTPIEASRANSRKFKADMDEAREGQFE